ncbi:S9 family peptidase [Hydrotalea sandarakina]|jgi:dipeptidyl aminopeptidase/acylaminoacyl peptidase|uniref:Dipeptidyl aminopeptidase/acylaminoacyl peptidase n=1 Tax=Hydrotalea sandarakina TaxID=1004304 RepID=A0A2W7RM58_9BACT|nr:S9 family peptidase [Hydrotalea sandarakina]PZX61883.1 dipeptidyl aminopeptidase/acylaminoacyl peptidase [Hydrotalea sandarakina]
MKKWMLSVALMLGANCFVLAQGPMNRNLLPNDVYKLINVGDPQVSPEGKWIAYTVSKADSAKDKRNTDIWMVSWDGHQTVQLTNTPDAETMPRWSPDGKYLSFISSRMGNTQSQIWLLDRRGGEAKQISHLKGDLEEYAWSPDGKKILISMQDPDYSDTAATKTRKPYVINRYHFKDDQSGYLDNRHTHLYVLDVATEKLDTLTSGNFDETMPAWSPDGKKIAFVSNHTTDPDKNDNTDIWVMNAEKNAQPLQLTTWAGSDVRPIWSPDGNYIAYLQSSSNLPFTMYGQNILAIVPAKGGTPVLLTTAVDRPVSNQQWAADGKYIYCLVTDDRKKYLAQVEVATKKIQPLVEGTFCLERLNMSNNHTQMVALWSDPYHPYEVAVIEGNTFHQVSHMNDDWMQYVNLAKVEGFTSTSKDGTKVPCILFTPSGSNNNKLPAIFYIHGGPVAQDDYAFDFTRQVLAAGNFAVVGVNYRGSNGSGLAYIKAIYADWGNKEVMDIIGAADYLIKTGKIDGNRMGIGGWSYGGISTNYTIATDNRFKAAASGAGSSLQLSMYGFDQYITQYETELGKPWEHPEKWMALSYPFFHVNKITTPTLFMASEKDFNVPTIGAEQMYQALKSVGVPTELVIYPGQHHGIVKPSYQVDRLERYLNWFHQYLK